MWLLGVLKGFLNVSHGLPNVFLGFLECGLQVS